MRIKTTLGQNIMLAASSAVLFAVATAIVTVYVLASRNRVSAIHEQMSGIIQQSETMTDNMDAMYRSHAFDTERLLKEAKEQAAGRPLRETYSSSALYGTIPIVAAWQSVSKEAKEHGFEFYTPTKPGIVARNPKNEPGTQFSEIFKAFEQGQKEFFLRDPTKNEVIVARPVILRESCLVCHGSPSQSLTKDGLDVLGLPMENLKAGDIKGAFVLKAPLTNDAVIGSTVKAMSLVGLGVLTLVLGSTVLFIRYLVSKPLNKVIGELHGVTGQVTGAAAELSASSQALAEGASEQAASLEETSASLEEISSMTQRNTQIAQGTKDFATQTRQAAETGVRSTQEMHAAMTAINTASAEMRDAMEGIKAASTDVSKIIKTIDEIAFQTNILALNAAVEAARAGEAGMGFAVVADEVRNLAQRSATAAKETAAMIQTAISRSEAGTRVNEKVRTAVDDVVAKSQHVTERLEEIVRKVHQMDEQVSQIATASTEQSQGITQVTKAVGEMDKVTQVNAASAEETASSAAELNAQADSLKQALHDLQALVGGTKVSSEPLMKPHLDFQTPASPAVQRPAPAARPAAARNGGNGHAKPQPLAAATRGSIQRPGATSPGPSDFRDF